VCWLFICFMMLINAVNVECMKKCSIRYYFSSPTCFGHSCDHNQVPYDKNTVNIQIIVQKYMIKPLCGTFHLQIKHNIWFTDQVEHHTFLNKYLYIDCILVISHSDVGQNSDRNILLKNKNMCLNMLINVCLLVYHISIQLWVTAG
jgi:hypothetical protein